MTGDLRITDYFLFTQHSLATFENCPLKFKKRYLENLKWDSFPDEAIKKRLEKGNNFHLLAQRYFMGIETGLDEFSEEFAELNGWLDNLKSKFKIKKDVRYLPEYKLRMSTPEIKLEANFDLLMADGESIEIWDWKTHGENSSYMKRDDKGKRLKESLQTKVYMFVLKEQASLVMGKDIDCSSIEMCYWQPEPQGVIARIPYSASMHEFFREELKSRIRSVFEYDYSGFEKEMYRKHCKYCEFNWLCNNERTDFKAVNDNDDIFDGLDWDSVEEKY